MGERPPSVHDSVTRSLYARMHEQGEALPEAAEQLSLAAADIDQARDQLTRLNLLNAESQTAADVTAALNRSLQNSHRLLDSLVEQHVRTATLARHYLDVSKQADSHAYVEFFSWHDRREHLSERIDELAELAEHEVLGMHPATPWTRESLEAGLARNETVLHNGVRVRGLHAQIAMANPLVREYMIRWRERGMEIRVTPLIPTRMLIYDRRTAVVQADPENLEAGAVLIRGGTVVRSLAAVYDYCWTTASEPEDVPRSADGVTLTEQQRAVLRMLAAGAKDSAIARSMGVSTRTVTRLVGELTEMLGASSRFQAGVRAARLGWLDAD
ncbi:regulatory LuxR family protein [Nonomuraea polychroma]|uniref:Regulatory LuxR family protein n=1 Tax=Nonomuraea polychroma TaxID=46176 RepID=A0A438MAH2_9ACTN|nr:helix-turn-helix transcriptional regulator [Nonomuraea polychroma]RVX42714.1 regulatory LuxR family protein [Nonomuraea polychroma]